MILTAKEYLSQYRKLNIEINSLSAELSQIRDLIYQTKGERVAGKSRGRNYKSGAVFEDLLARIEIISERINAKIDAAVKIRDEISAAIDRVENEILRTLLRYRYICCYTWERIAVELNYTERNVCYLHGKALQVIKFS